MKNIVLFFVYTLILLTGYSCNRLKNCHREIKIENNSLELIIVSRAILEDGFGECSLFYETQINPNSSKNVYFSRDCIEDILSDGRTFDFYIIDENNIELSGEFFTCDSLLENYNILKSYKLTLSDLETNNFTINYP